MSLRAWGSVRKAEISSLLGLLSVRGAGRRVQGLKV